VENEFRIHKAQKLIKRNNKRLIIMSEMMLLQRVHHCKQCKVGTLENFVPKQYPPVYSFGDPKQKSIIVVSINPSSKEYEDRYLSSSPEMNERIKSQMCYFHGAYYNRFFGNIEKFFYDEVKEMLQWIRNPWEKVGFLDLVKCVTKSEKGQWSKLDEECRMRIIKNCEGYLKEQISFYRPKIIIVYGKDVCKWFARQSGINYKQWENETVKWNNHTFSILFLYQLRQGLYTESQTLRVRRELRKILNGDKENMRLENHYAKIV